MSDVITLKVKTFRKMSEKVKLRVTRIKHFVDNY